MRVLATLAAIVVTLTLLSGCEDGDARQRAEVQKALTEASKELRKATAGSFEPGTEDGDKARAALDRVIKTLNGINPEDDGQKAAKSLLTANALREAAFMDLAKADMIESQQSATREELATKIDAITVLSAIADGHQKINPAADKESLDKDRQASLQRIDELSKRIEQLDGPIGDRTTANDNAKQEVEKLKAEVNDLRRKASELGNADGFVTYQQAVETRRKADKIEYDISQREMELGYSLQPDHDLADEESKHLQSRVTTLQATNQELDAFAKSTADSIAVTRKEIAELSDQVTAALKKLSDTATTELIPLYEQAEASLQKAAGMASAGGAGSADDMSVARLLKARILELQGKFNALKASSLADHKALLQKLNDAGKAMPSSADIKSELDAAGAAMTAAMEKAKASFTEAMDALSQVKSRDDAVELFRKNLENAVAVMSGQKVWAPSKESTTETPAGGNAAPASVGSPGHFATAKELVNYLASLPQNLEGGKAGQAVQRAQTAEGRKLVQINAQMMEALVALDSAMKTKFNVGLIESLGPAGAAVMAGMRTDLSAAKPTEESEDQVVYSVTVMGQTMPVTLRQADGSWWVDADAQAQFLAKTMPALTQMSSAMIAAYNDVAKRVTAGEFATAQAAVAAMGQAMQKAMGSGAPPAGGTINP